MDYPHMVRQALTTPSGRPIKNVSPEEHSAWVAFACDGSMENIYAGYTVTLARIRGTAKFNTKAETDYGRN